MATSRESNSARQRFHLRDLDNGSATPPPIANGRRVIIDDDAYEEDYRLEHSTPPVSFKPRHPDGQMPYRSQSMLRNGQRSASFSHGTKSPIAGARTPVMDFQRLYDNFDSDTQSNNGSTTGHYQQQMEHRRLNNGGGPTQLEGSQFNVVTSPLSEYRGRDGGNYFNRDADATSISKQSTISTGSGRLPDFFGPGIFQVVLHNPTTAHQLLKFSQARYCSENVEFLAKLEQYYKIMNDLTITMTDIHRDFISPQAKNQINLPDSTMKTVHVGMKTIVTSTLPAMEQVFMDVQEKIEEIVFTDIYPRFVRYQMTMSATRALANDRNKYQGLGDCFCLTDPSKADNPIVFASEGFVKVTGYTRKEIIPRNCRFLQGQHTDREPIRRLKSCIEERKESVELILNYKKNGDPFWNLLYVAPLYNAAGKVAFFIGGQINCSTTIHSSTDVMRILSTSGDVSEDKNARQALPRTQSGNIRKSGFLGAFRSREQNNNMNSREAGMEQDLLNKIEGRDLKAQMNAFYTAYSKYIVVKYETFYIEFYSPGVKEMLNPTNPVNNHIVGHDIFKFLKANAGNSSGSDYKTRIRNSLKGGYPISVEFGMETRRSAMFRGNETFVTHWTPLKDENSIVNYIVVTLSPLLSEL